MSQLVGKNCVICRKQITSILDANFCAGCGNPVHQQCQKTYRAPDEAAGQTLCPDCGGDPHTAPTASSGSAKGISPVYCLWALAAIAILAMVAYLAWPSEESITQRLIRQQQTRQGQEGEIASGNPIVEIETTMGTIRAELFQDKAPETVRNFVDLVEQKFYDGIIFHRVIKDFMLQTGDPLGNGMGGRTDKGLPPKRLADEFHASLRHDKPGILSMANSGPNTGDTQFFITTVATPWLDNKHAIFGQVITGMDVVHKIENVPTDANDRPTDEVRILSARMVEREAEKSDGL